MPNPLLKRFLLEYRRVTRKSIASRPVPDPIGPIDELDIQASPQPETLPTISGKKMQLPSSSLPLAREYGHISGVHQSLLNSLLESLAHRLGPAPTDHYRNEKERYASGQEHE